MIKRTKNSTLGWKFAMLFIVLGLFIIPSVSAFGEVSNYNPSNETIVINSNFGLPLISSTISELRLLTPHDNLVMPGHDRLVAEILVNNYDGSFSGAIQDMALTDVRTGQPIERDIVYKYKTSDFIDVNDTTSVCENVTSDNNTIIEQCHDELIGSVHKEESNVQWHVLDTSQPLPLGVTDIGVFTTVLPSDNVEWVMTYHNVPLTPWATWTSGLNVGLKAYWKMNETTGTTLLDSVGSAYNATWVGSGLNWTPNGKIDGGLKGYSLVGNYTKVISNGLDVGTGEYSVAFWVNLTDTSSNGWEPASYNHATGATNYWYILCQSASWKFKYSSDGADRLNFGTCAANASTFIALTRNATCTYASINGASLTKASACDGLSHSGGNFTMAGGQGVGGFGGILDEMGFWNRSLSQAEITQLANSGAGMTYVSSFPSTVVQISPNDGTNTTSNGQTFVCNQTSTGMSLVNNTLYIWNSTGSLILTNYTVVTGTTTNQTSNSMILPYNDAFKWGCVVGDSSGITSTVSNFTITLDTRPPSISISFPLNQTYANVNVSILNFTASDSGGHLQSCWYSTNAGTTNTSVACGNLNVTGLNPSEGGNTWFFAANDSLGNSNYTSVAFTMVTSPAPNIVIPASGQIIQMPPDNFSFNYSTGSDPYLQSCFYSLNGAANVSLTCGTNATINFTSIGNQTIILYANDSLGILNSTIQKFYAAPTFAFCNATISPPAFLNITFKDETFLTATNATMVLTGGSYWFGNDTGQSYPWSYTNTTSNNPSYAFCSDPKWGNLSVNASLAYASTGSSFSQRTYALQPISLSNSTTNLVLYLLSAFNGQIVTFQVVNPYLSPLSGVLATATATINGNATQVASAVTDNSGGATMFLSPVTSYQMQFSKAGYITYTASITPSNTAYTITLTPIGTNNVTNINTGTAYSISPADSYLNQSTNYTFNFYFSTTGAAMDKIGVNITNGTANLYTSQVSSVTSGNFTASINTSNYGYITMTPFWTSGNTTNTISKTWTVTNINGQSYSILQFTNDLGTYTKAGFGGIGLNAFSLNIIIFLIIFVSTGIMSWKFGLYSPTAIVGIVFAESLLFDAVLGLVTLPANAPQGFLTFFVGMVLAALLIKEAVQY